ALQTGKVDTVTGKVLSSNDYTNAEKTKLAGLANYSDVAITARVATAEADIDALETAMATKQAKETGKGLSTNDFTDDYKTKLEGLQNYDDVPLQMLVLNSLEQKVDKVEGKTLSTNDYTTAEKNKLAGLANYNDVPLQTALVAMIDTKVDKVTGKGLSTNDYTATEKTKLSGIAANATA
ncbi:hypothetical protein G3V96_26705, partial [Escherichia coli]|nr:hypothetical protein [Escherichia coli]